MFAKIKQHEIEPADLWKGDLFKRKDYANVLVGLLKSTRTANVIGISAPYGFGKTFFLTRLREQIKLEQGWAVYVNAWEYDYLDNPLFGLLDALKAAAGELPTAHKAKKALKEVVVAAAPAIAKAASKKLVERLLGEEGSEELADAMAEASGKSTENVVQQFLEDDTTHHALDTLRGEIKKFVSDNIAEKSPYPNLIVIVDELDRARPNFSIRFLETVKHVFGAAQTIFLIGCDKAVLGSSARHEYGSELDIDGYLRRLFDFWVELPAPESKAYIKYCAGALGLVTDGVLGESDNFDSGLDAYADYLIDGCNYKPMSLRFIEQCVCHMNILVRSIPANGHKHIALIGWLQGFRHFDENAYARYLSSSQSLDALHAATRDLPRFASMEFYKKAWPIVWGAREIARLNPHDAKVIFGGNYADTVSDLLRDSGFRSVGKVSLAKQMDQRLRTIISQITR